jgi:excisionase family DNA binding protein
MKFEEEGPVPYQGDAVLTVKEVSEYLKLAESTVYKLVQENKLPGRKIGGAWRFSRRMLERWLEQPSDERESTQVDVTLPDERRDTNLPPQVDDHSHLA